MSKARNGSFATTLLAVLFVALLSVAAPQVSVADGYDDAAAVARAKELIAALPADPDAIDVSYRDAVETATTAFDALSASDRSSLDSEVLDKEQSYGRWLESAQWGLEAATETVDDSTGLSDGDYSAYISSSSDMGKSTSERARSWSAVRLFAKGGRLAAVIRCDGESAFRKLRMGGVDYTADSVDGVPEFSVPMQPNAVLKFTVDASEIADSIAYELEVRIDLSRADEAERSQACSLADRALAGIRGSWKTSSRERVRAAAESLREVAGKGDAMRVELQRCRDELSSAQDAAARTATAAVAGKGAGDPASGGPSASKKNASGSSGDSRAREGSEQASPAVQTAADAAVSSASADAGERGASDSARKKASPRTGAVSAVSGPGRQVAAGAASGSEATAAEGAALPSGDGGSPFTVVLCLAFLLVFGMVLRTVVFGRQMGLFGPVGEGGDAGR